MNSHEPNPDCIKRAMSIIGNKWTALIIRELADNARRFSQLEQSIPAINPRTLSKRLDDLQSEGIIKSCNDSSAYSHRCYALTDKGRDLLPIIEEMAKWGDKHNCDNQPGAPGDDPRWNIA